MDTAIYVDQQYQQWLTDLKTRIRESQTRAGLKVDVEMLSLYWELGKAIVEKQVEYQSNTVLDYSQPFWRQNT